MVILQKPRESSRALVSSIPFEVSRKRSHTSMALCTVRLDGCLGCEPDRTTSQYERQRSQHNQHSARNMTCLITPAATDHHRISGIHGSGYVIRFR